MSSDEVIDFDLEGMKIVGRIDREDKQYLVFSDTVKDGRFTGNSAPVEPGTYQTLVVQCDGEGQVEMEKTTIEVKVKTTIDVQVNE